MHLTILTVAGYAGLLLKMEESCKLQST